MSREECVNRLTVVASEDEEVNLVSLVRRSDEYVENDIQELLAKHKDVLSDIPGQLVQWRLRLM